METIKKRTWKPTAAGILNIITGAVCALILIFVIIAIISFYNMNIRQFLPSDFEPPPGFDLITIPILIFMIILVAFPVIGGVFTLQRRKWRWALAGSIIALIATFVGFPLGIASTILVSLSKDEFE